MVGEAQIEPQTIQCGVGVTQGRLARRTALALRDKDRLLAIQCGIHETQGDGLTVDAREALRLRQQPAQEVIKLRQQDEVFRHARLPPQPRLSGAL